MRQVDAAIDAAQRGEGEKASQCVRTDWPIPAIDEIEERDEAGWVQRKQQLAAQRGEEGEKG
jgi:hypothetical protein